MQSLSNVKPMGALIWTPGINDEVANSEQVPVKCQN